MNRFSKIKVNRVSHPSVQNLLARRWPISRGVNPELEAYISPIIKRVRDEGDKALIKLTREFDGVEIKKSDLRVTDQEINAAYERVEEEQILALKYAKGRLENLDRILLESMIQEIEYEGIDIQSGVRPIPSVGCYIPGGGAAYPSTVIMTVAPAKTAGVPRVAVASPPRENGEIDSLTLIAADICGADEIYRVGGIQAIAALAYGTETIKPVDKIVGPGNKYVSASKSIISKTVPIDMPAGPSEIAILADDSANPIMIAMDMVAQAEHGEESQAILVTISEELARNVSEELEIRIRSFQGKGSVAKSIYGNGQIIICPNLDEAITFVNKLAPEHLEIMVEDYQSAAEKIESTNLILLGNYTPVSASDYCLGTNHVLPTGGFGHIFSGLSVLDFIRRVLIVKSSKDAFMRMAKNIEILAESEGLPSHAQAVKERIAFAQE